MSGSPPATLGLAARPLAPQKAASDASPTSAHPPSLTQKTWVVPPRPKPGRKPATDTPSSKRKAQNRVAQRAFRERKAAKIGELEELMDQMLKEHHAEVADLRAELQTLSTKLDQQLAGGVDGYEQDLRTLKAELDAYKSSYAQERRLREELEKEISIIKGEAVSLPRRSQEHVAAQSYSTPEEMPLGCNRCSTTHCQCLEDVLNVGSSADGSQAKRAASPSAPSQSSGKKAKSDREATHPGQLEAPEPMAPPGDQCGFCNDGSTCLCRELAAERSRELEHPSSLPSPPGEEVNDAAPNPMEIDFTNMAPSKPKPYASGPGTCEQCRSDPSSKGFCKGLAAARAAGLLHQSSGETISCAQAFSRLKQHPAFDRASKIPQEWLPQLATVPQKDQHGGPGSSRPGYSAFEIESASVLGVLRFFDRKFGMDF